MHASFINLFQLFPHSQRARLAESE
jgi:hypothetical protein